MNQFFGSVSNSGPLRGPKGDKGDPGIAGPPYLSDHIGLEPDHLSLKMNLLPFSDLKADLGSESRRFRTVYAKDLVISAETLNIQDPGSEDKVSISYATKGEGAGRSRVAVKPAEGGDFSVQSITTSRANPDKLDPELMDISGLRFRGTLSADPPDVLDTVYDSYAERFPDKPIEPGDYFLFTDEGRLTYQGFTQEQQEMKLGDLVIFTDLSPLKQWAKVPFRIPHFGVDTIHLAEKSVNSSKISNGAVVTDKVADKAITSQKLTDDVTVQRLFAKNVHASVAQVDRHNTYYVNQDKDVTYDDVNCLKFGPTEHGAWRFVTNPSGTDPPLIRIQVYDGPSTTWLTKFELDGLEVETFD